ncbi:MAG TPA: hypothetical protein VJX70_11755 [Candidatus Acidoferrum sp.]|nr:hypothetical protein [Candidatus Acidoferrum sp.]
MKAVLSGRRLPFRQLDTALEILPKMPERITANRQPIGAARPV